MGTKTLNEFVPKLDGILQDDAGLLTLAERQNTVEQAVVDYSHDRPLRKKFDFNGDGIAFQIPAPADWAGEFSQVLSIEHPADERVPVYLERGDWEIYRKVDGTDEIRLLATTPQTGKKARIEYTLPHTQPAETTATSAPDADFLAIVERAAHHAFLVLAAKSAQSIDPSISADSVDRQAQADRYNQMARLHAKNYDRLLGKDRDETPAAGGAVVDLDTEAQVGTDHLTHPSRLR